MSTSNIVHNDTFAEKWVSSLAPPEWRDRVRLEFRHVPLAVIDGAGCLIDSDVVDGWRLMLRNGKRIPPLVVCATERGTYYTLDGNHRLEAIWYEYGKDLVVRVAVMVPIEGYCFRRRALGHNYTYALERSRNWAVPFVRVFLPLLFSALAVALTAFVPAAESSPYFVLLLAAVVASAWLAGLAGGLIATLLAVTSAAFFLIEPIHSLAVAELAHLVQLGVAALAMLLLSWILGSEVALPHKTRWRY
ncbi:MAG: DUF4118 domain-containing protein [Acidobacteriales bacterium]|nr:DUF4118 domain-containing protein [Terriglobales bacterium]